MKNDIVYLYFSINVNFPLKYSIDSRQMGKRDLGKCKEDS